MQKTIDKFIWKFSTRQQIILAVITAGYFPTLYAMLELPKIIINSALSTSRPHKILEYTLNPIEFLSFLCVIYFILYLMSSLIKLILNIKKGILGERMVRRLRHELIENLLRFPIQRFRKVSQGEIISQITSETEPLNGYISDALALPLFQGGTMITILGFMFFQNFWLGLTSIALMPLQIYFIPKFQRQINLLNRERVRQKRQLSEHIGETVSGALAIRVHGVQRYVLANFSMRMNRLFNIRYQIYKKKFLMKFTNNFINQMTPFFFYFIGGILVLKGQLTIGALVAALAAYKNLTTPWTEILKYYQIQQDAKIKYEQLIEQFDIEDLDESDYYAPVEQREQCTLFPVSFKHVVTGDDGQRVLEGLQLELAEGEHLAIIEPSLEKRNHIAELILSLRQPDYGTVWLGETQIQDVTGTEKSRRLAYQPSSPPIFNTSMFENILLSIKHQPTEVMQGIDAKEAERSGDSYDLYDAEWTDYSDYQFESETIFFDWYVRTMQAAREDRNMTRNGLFRYLETDRTTIQTEQFIAARNRVLEELANTQICPSLQPFNESTWYPSLSIAENLAFGKSIQRSVVPAKILQSEDVVLILQNNGFDRVIEQIGLQIAQRIHQGLSRDFTHEQTMFDFKIPSEQEAADVLTITRKLVHKDTVGYSKKDKSKLMQLFLNLVPEDHSNFDLPGSVISKIIFLREEIDNVLTTSQRTQLPGFELDQYHPGLTVLENLLFARLPKDIDDKSQEAVLTTVYNIIEKAGLDREIMLLTLKSAATGIGGSLLSPTSKQGMPLVRALIKKPEILIVNDGLTVYDEPEQLKIKENIRALLPKTAVLWLTEEVSDTRTFDRVIDFRTK